MQLLPVWNRKREYEIVKRKRRNGVVECWSSGTSRNPVASHRVGLSSGWRICRWVAENKEGEGMVESFGVTISFACSMMALRQCCF